MLRELVPFMGISNLAMGYGMDCWSVVGAQGKYDLATWISLLSTWGICMPLSALFTLGYHFNLQGLMAASIVGYVTTSACLSCVVLSSNWPEIALQISEKNVAEEMGDDDIDTPTVPTPVNGEGQEASARPSDEESLLL